MSIKFMTGSIKLGKSKSLVEMVKEATASKNVVKTAQVLQIVPEVSHSVELEGHEEKKACPCACESEVEVLPEESEVKELVMASKKELPAFIQQKIDAKKEDKEEKSEKKQEEKSEKKEASSSQFVKIAKLNKASKDLLRAEFEAIYPKDFVDAMLAEY